MDVPSDIDSSHEDLQKVEQAVAILGLLEEIGLRGPLLAVSKGDEDELARQLTRRLGFEYKPWHREYVEGHVRAAVQMEDLELRLGGSAASASRQRILDATVALEKEARAQAEEEAHREASFVAPPREGTLGKSVRLRTGRIVTEDEAETKVLNAMIEELRLAGAPILKDFEKVRDPQRALKSLTGKYRPSTLRRYLAGWQHYRKWCSMGDNPKRWDSYICFIDYLFVREEEGMGPSIPLAVSRAVGWFQELAGVEEAE